MDCRKNSIPVAVLVICTATSSTPGGCYTWQDGNHLLQNVGITGVLMVILGFTGSGDTVFFLQAVAKQLTANTKSNFIISLTYNRTLLLLWLFALYNIFMMQHPVKLLLHLCKRFRWWRCIKPRPLSFLFLPFVFPRRNFEHSSFHNISSPRLYTYASLCRYSFLPGYVLPVGPAAYPILKHPLIAKRRSAVFTWAACWANTHHVL